jgi:hypothetical protein
MAAQGQQRDRKGWANAGLLDEIAESVAWLRMNRPDRANAMDHYPTGGGPEGTGLRDALLAAIHDASEDKGRESGRDHLPRRSCATERSGGRSSDTRPPDA